MNDLSCRTCAAALSLMLACYVPGARAQTYKVVDAFTTEGTVNGLAMDSAGRRLYVAGSGGVSILNADTGAKIGDVAGIKAADDVLVVPVEAEEGPGPSTTGFASTDSTVVMFDLASSQSKRTEPLATRGPSSLCYDTFGNQVEAVSAAGSITSVDANTGRVVKSGKLATGSGQIACGNLGHVFVADPAANVIHILNHNTMQSDGDYPMLTGSKPVGLALDTKGRRLFVACEDGTLEIIDTDSGFTFIELHSGHGAARGVFAWLPQGKGQWKAGAFFTHADGTLTGVRMMAFINYTLGGEWKLTAGGGPIVFDEKTHHLLFASPDGSGKIMVAGY